MNILPILAFASTFRKRSVGCRNATSTKYLKEKDFSDNKKVIVDRMIYHCGAMYTGKSLQCDYSAPFLFVSGPPGVGKTHMVKALVDISKILNVGDVVRGAYMGITGVNVRGSSLCSLMDIPTDQSGKEKLIRPWRLEKLDDFKRMLT